MSTRSCIIVKVRKEDIGKVMKFKAKLLPVKQVDFSEFGVKRVRDKAKDVTLSEYIGIYCHSDGYIDGVGYVLKELFNDYEKALNLVLGGFCSFVWYDGVRRYAIRKYEEWKYIKPCQAEKVEDVYKYIDSAYCYLFEDGKGWSVNTYDDNLVGDDGRLYPAPTFKEYAVKKAE